MAEITETHLLQQLEGKVRAMFDFTGWSDGVDDDAAQAIINVDAILKDLTDWRLLQSRYSTIISGKDTPNVWELIDLDKRQCKRCHTPLHIERFPEPWQAYEGARLACKCATEPTWSGSNG